MGDLYDDQKNDCNNSAKDHDQDQINNSVRKQRLYSNENANADVVNQDT